MSLSEIFVPVTSFPTLTTMPAKSRPKRGKSAIGLKLNNTLQNDNLGYGFYDWACKMCL